MKICALIPVYNNAGAIAEVVRRARAVIEPDLLVVDDGSTDRSGAEASGAGARVITLIKNQGKGRAIRHGLLAARDAGYTHAITLDGDGQHLPEDIPKFVDALHTDPDRLWIGVRAFEGQAVPAASRRGRAISNFWITVDGWQRCRDAQSGMRAYPIEKTLALKCREDRFAFELEVLIRAAWAGVRLGHIAIDVRYPAGADRVSHFDKRRDNWRATWICFTGFLGMLPRAPRLLLGGP